MARGHVPTTDRADAPRLPLTAAQRGMWFAENLSPGYSVNIAQYVDLGYAPGTLDHRLLAQCHESACRALESPFLRISLDDGDPRQRVDLDYQTVDVIDLRAEADPEAAAHAWMRGDYQRTLDLLTDQLVVSALLRIADDRTLWYMRGHHIVIDGYSALTMLRMTAERYNAALRGTDIIEPPRATVAEIVDDEHRYGASTRREADRAYWRDRAVDLPQRVTLSKVTAPASLSAQNAVAHATLDADVTARLEEIARTLSTSPAVVLAAATAVLFARMTDSSDIVLSLPVTGRASARIKNAGGMLANIVPIRVGVESTERLADVVAHVRTELTGALRHQRYRSEDIRREAGLSSDATSFGPIVNVMFFDRPIAIDGTSASYHILSSGVLEDLRVNLYRAGPGEPVVVDLHGNRNLYSQREIERHHARLMSVIAQLATDPNRQVGHVSVLTETDRTEISRWERGRRVDYQITSRTHLLDAFDRTVATSPDAPAVRYAGVTHSYAQFDALVDLIAARLRGDGIVSGARVAIAVPRGPRQVAAVYATLRLGATYVPIGDTDPQDRRRLVLDAAAPAVIVDDSYLSGIPDDPVDRSGTPRVARPAQPPASAYIIFTSGSTGLPKGVEVGHAAVANRLAWMQEHYPLDNSDAVLYKTPITFDVSVWELLWPLAIGARMVIAAPGGHRDPRYLVTLIDDESVSTLHFVPSMLDVFVDVIGADEDAGRLAQTTSVRQLFTSGEALPHSLAARVMSRLPDLDVINLYGPTEAAVDVTEHRVAITDQPVPIGTPVPNTTVHVLDSHLTPTPAGVSGELYLAGVQLADGYVGRMALSAERFVADPFAIGQRMYRTGDLVRWNHLGQLEYLGRSDFQRKIRGQRVELGDIEAQIAAEPTVDAVAVVVREDRGRPELVAYIKPVTASPSHDDVAPYERFCRRRLASHMVPSVIVLVESFVLNSSGKLDRSALPVPDYERRTPRVFVPPTSATELAVADLLRELLAVERISMRDSIFRLGGDSLLAARLVARLHTDHGMDLTLTAVFDAADVGELAAAATPAASIAAGPVPARPEVLELSPMQSRLWFVHHIEPSSATYNMPGAVWISDFHAGAMAAAVADVVERHEVLRTRYPAVGGEPRQEILPAAPPADGLFTVLAETGPGIVAAARRYAATGFDITAAPPLRVLAVTDADRAAADALLVVVLHHIAADGASLPILLSELLAAYSARRAGAAPRWAPLATHYADVALTTQAALGDIDDPTSEMYRQAQFWARELSGATSELALPTDHPRPALATGRGGYVDVELDAASLAPLTELAAAAGVTLFTVLHAAVALVLSRVGGTDDVSIGTAVAGRRHPGAEALIGMFVNTVVLRTRVEPGMRVIDFLAEAQRVRGRALSHADIPFQQIVDAAAPGHPPSPSPLFAVMITMLTDVVEDALIDAGLQQVDVRPPVAKYDLTISFARRRGVEGDRLAIEFSYATDIFAQSTVLRVADWMFAVLTEMAHSPTGRLAHLDLFDVRRALDSAQPRTRVRPTTMRALIAEGIASAQPHAVAISGESEVTYSVLASRVNQTARELISRGIGPGDVVAVLARRSATSVCAALAINAAGAAFVTIDPTHPADRRAALLADSGAVLALTIGEFADDEPVENGSSVALLILDDPATEWQLAGHRATTVTDDELCRRTSVDDLAYLIYTSGSTGTPKAVAVTNRGLANFTDNLQRKFGATASSRVLHVASPTFDASILELMTAFAVGGRLVVAPPEVFAGRELEQLIAAHKVTHLLLTPSALATIDPATTGSLRVVISAGEACPGELVRRWGGRRGCGFYNLYGPTEVTVWSTTDGPLGADDAVTVGDPIDGIGAVILDAALRPTPDGVAGELYLAGDQLARGYLGRPDLSSTRFVANPFTPGTRMYRTGDRVTRGADGRLIYHGRNDFQLKIRGLRIEPGEIDAVLSRHREVANSVTLGVPGPAGATVLVSYVVLVGGADVTAAQLQAHAAHALPAYMIPDHISIIDEFPVTSVGKIDRGRLPAIDFAVTADFVAPRTELESVIGDVVGQILGLARVSVTDSFFELGGNSLSATRVAAKLSDITAQPVSVREIFDNPTVSALAGLVEGVLAGRPSTPMTARRHTEIVPLSALQRGMWLANQVDPDSAAYNVALALRLTGVIDIAALAAAVDDVIDRHEALRTRYPYIDGAPVQVIAPVSAARHGALRVIEVDGDEATAIAELTNRGFDLAAEPPVRAALLEVAPGVHVIVVVVHHISADGASMVPLAADLGHAYQQRLAGSAPSWRPLAVQYADFTEWHHDRLAEPVADGGTERDRQLDYWRERLDGAPGLLEIIADRPRPATPTYAGGRVTATVAPHTVAALEALARVGGTTLFLVAHAAFAVLLRRLSGQRDIVVGTPYAGRGRGELDGVVGMFVNTLALRTVVADDEPFVDLLGRVRGGDLTDMAHADVAFDDIVAAVLDSPPVNYNPIYQVLFVFQNITLPTLHLDALTVEPVSEGLVSAKVDLTLTLFPDPRTGELRAEFDYATDLFDQSTIEVVAHGYLALLEAIVADPHLPVGDLSYSSAPLHLAPAGAEASTDPLPTLLSAAAVIDPTGVAVALDGVDVTFGDLAETTTAMAIGAGTDLDSSLTMALMGLLPDLALAGAAELDAVLVALRTNARTVVDAATSHPTDSHQTDSHQTDSHKAGRHTTEKGVNPT
ncbi:amino acid adenylation domain-containing protein [Gordonia asplenii]|uniref:amino acid adenylation domain-containing protein n=1 Tax=Gordonia asplenii TaxID=2725283 RepID=UPI001FE4BB15|nr:non-ribosomal peptide synthetase [Gordonia asplenii]